MREFVVSDVNAQKQKILTLDITNSNEEQKEKLRGAIKYFSGDKNNINVQVKVQKELKGCGAIYLTDEILEIFENILGKENVIL